MPGLPTRATLLTAPLGTLPEWSVTVSCPCRTEPTRLLAATLAERHGAATPLEQVLTRLRCTACRRPPTRVQARRDAAGTPHAPTVTLLEPRVSVDRNRG